MSLANPQALVDRLSQKQKKLSTLLVGANVAIALILLALMYAVHNASKQSYESQAQSLAEGIATIAQANVGSELNLIDAVLRATADEVQRLKPGAGATTPLVDEILQTRLNLLPGAEAFRLTDRSGLVQWGTGLPPGQRMDVSDRPYFMEAQRRPSEQTLVAGPVRSRVSGNWVLVFIRPLTIEGEFAGILYVSVNVDHFQRLFSQYDLGEKDAVTLRARDLALVARHSPGALVLPDVGETAVSDALKRAATQNSASGFFVSKVAIDGEMRSTAYRAVGDWPFTVYAGVSHSRFFQAWRDQVWTHSALAGFLWCLVVLATFATYRSGVKVAHGLQALADQTERTNVLLRIAGDGIHIINSDGVLVEMSDSFAEMLRSTREKLLGKHISEWDANQNRERVTHWLSKLKDRDHQRVDVQHRRDDGTVIDVDLQMRAVNIGGELLVFGSARDVSDIKRLVVEQTAMLENELVGMAKIEDRHFSWRNAAFERVFGYASGELAGLPTRVIYLDDATHDFIGKEAYSVLQSGSQYRTQLRMRKKDGAAVWVDFGAVRFAENCVLVLAVDITAAREAHDHLAHAAFHDPLTQLPNRLLLKDRLVQALGTAQREGTRVAICYMDLDGFKAVNDTLGHETGDALLKEVARRLLRQVRASDTAARVGGDEFVLILTNIEGEEWSAILERVSLAVREPFVVNGAVSQVGATLGVALSSPDETAEELMDRADHKMLEGKRRGKGTITVAGDADGTRL
ncbi:bifunctional diguanylate cyclase/phosphodiesterase [Pseudorhodoferax soli]|uniref:PAS domain S-box-containing protein/diguanylate cyclase (GGDEF)-like protein n=1 Tax=Pseudorhodoferax soli TaxID=545864 RepID=A0A368XR50_9BURK|nr:diguanylate cyclase [Pseudorhodoferax soli]RCW70355.1 PAS domain S-box-containing protein/diguanylate cyclase (GGDEF)-like protein [Pseudorhodoferax soli]